MIFRTGKIGAVRKIPGCNAAGFDWFVFVHRIL
jgi:hypothetical protein